MTASLSNHAYNQISARRNGQVLSAPKMAGGVPTGRWVTGIMTVTDVVGAVDAQATVIRQLNQAEVHVVVRRLDVIVQCTDGSNGNLIVAAVDTATMKVKTVMLRQTGQRTDSALIGG